MNGSDGACVARVGLADGDIQRLHDFLTIDGVPRRKQVCESSADGIFWVNAALGLSSDRGLPKGLAPRCALAEA
jgi:hypothetical protein